MKFIIKQNTLMEHLNYVIRGVSSKNLIPVLNCIKFDVKKEGIYLSSTDNEIAIKTVIDKREIDNIEETGSFIVNGRHIYEYVRKLPGKIITIESLVDSQITICTQDLSSKTNLNCNKVEEFPTIEIEESKDPIILDKKIFKNIINQTIFATSSEESRPVLTGINLKITGNKLECTATDSYRLAKKVVLLPTEVKENIDVIIPTRNLNELLKMLDDEDTLELNIFNNKIIFRFDSITMLSRIINVTYPDVNKLIPDSFELEVKINLNEFYNAIDRVSLFTNENEKNTIKFELKNNNVVISSNLLEKGDGTETLTCTKNVDKELKIAFSSRYMLDAIKSFNCEEICLMFNGEIKPIIIKSVEDDNLIQLILPIRTY